MAASAGRRSWKRTCSRVRPRRRLSLVSGTRITVRPSLAPRATVTSRSSAARCLVPRSRGSRSVRDGQRGGDAAPVRSPVVVGPSATPTSMR